MQNTNSSRAIIFAVVAAAFVFLPPVVNAQQPGHANAGQHTGRHPVFITVDLGMYMPVGSLVLDSTIQLRGIGAIKVGSMITVPVRDRFALEAALAWSPSMVVHKDWKETRDLEGGVLLTSVRGRLRLNGDTRSNVEAFCSSGFGVVHRYGSAWHGLTGRTDRALILGVGLNFRDNTSRVSYALALDDFLTRTDFTDITGIRYGGRLHNDMVFAMGVVIELAGR